MSKQENSPHHPTQIYRPYNTLSRALLILSKKPPKFIEDLKIFEIIQEKTGDQFKKEIDNYYNIMKLTES